MARQAAAPYRFLGNDPVDMQDAVGFIECKSIGSRSADPSRHLDVVENASGSQASCKAWYWQKAVFRQSSGWDEGICNGGHPLPSYVKIWAKHECPRRFQVTCTYQYIAKAASGPMAAGAKPVTIPGGFLNGTVLQTQIHVGKFGEQSQDGIWSATLHSSRTITDSICIGEQYVLLVFLHPNWGTGTAVGPDGPIIPARFGENMNAFCTFKDIGPCL
jgi:hypothetical protein